MKYFGAHVSAMPDVSYSPLYAQALGAMAFAMFTAEENSFRPVDIPDDIAEKFRSACSLCGYTPDRILPHAGFMMNCAAPDRRKHAFATAMLRAEFSRAARLGLTMVNFHPGSTLGAVSDDEGCRLVAGAINSALDKTEGVTAVIENMAGQGSVLGRSLEQIAAMIDLVEDKSRVGFCIDTCHAFAAGYDISTPEGLQDFVGQIDSVIGLRYLRAMHLNDSRKACGLHIDRHESIGRGEIGAESFRLLAGDPRFDGIPLILETPDESVWKDEISLLESWSDNKE